MLPDGSVKPATESLDTKNPLDYANMLYQIILAISGNWQKGMPYSSPTQKGYINESYLADKGARYLIERGRGPEDSKTQYMWRVMHRWEPVMTDKEMPGLKSATQDEAVKRLKDKIGSEIDKAKDEGKEVDRDIETENETKTGVVYVTNPLEQGNPIRYYVDANGNVFEIDAKKMTEAELRQKIGSGDILDEKTDYPGKHAYFINANGEAEEFGKKDLVFMADIFIEDDKGNVLAKDYLVKNKMWLAPGSTVLLPSFSSVSNNLALSEYLKDRTVTVDLETGKILEVSKQGENPTAF